MLVQRGRRDIEDDLGVRDRLGVEIEVRAQIVKPLRTRAMLVDMGEQPMSLVADLDILPRLKAGDSC